MHCTCSYWVSVEIWESEEGVHQQQLGECGALGEGRGSAPAAFGRVWGFERGESECTSSYWASVGLWVREEVVHQQLFSECWALGERKGSALAAIGRVLGFERVEKESIVDIGQVWDFGRGERECTSSYWASVGLLERGE